MALPGVALAQVRVVAAFLLTSAVALCALGPRSELVAVGVVAGETQRD